MRTQLYRICPEARSLGYRSRQGWTETLANRRTRFDDLIPEESENVQKAIKRLPAKEAYDRVFRIRRAFQVRPTPFLCIRLAQNLTNVSIAVLHLPHSPSRQRADQARGGESPTSKFRPPRIGLHIGQSCCMDLSHSSRLRFGASTHHNEHNANDVNQIGRRVP